ncbi:hypothetical protein IPV09_10275 [Tessaracoccus sp. SD287]|uniref:pilus assembly protein TadG-related protein n=1 Tax=Tessaracoccus sp. SD287 TaxID=2782008 RepID=UPI001A957491|nr:pilus assembly protein TadG-related protein [Tessaracoccus sp. SD287]MBO1031717.1 hypothetical protein [Tessaracoccus sp. SD287]
MWRLNRGRAAQDERGATAVMVALVMVLLLGFCAISIDVAALYSARQKLQVGADAAALAIAKDCAAGDCGTDASRRATADHYARANSDPSSSGRVIQLFSNRVEVEASATTEHWFAPALGFNSKLVTTKASAEWGLPVAGRAILPLAIGECEWNVATHGGTISKTDITKITVHVPAQKDNRCPTETASGSGYMPGGFGWLPEEGDCSVATEIGVWIPSRGGKPSSCPEKFSKYLNQPVLIPIFKEYQGSPVKAYLISGFAAFSMTGYWFNGSQWGGKIECNPSDSCIQGYFLGFVAGRDWELGTTGNDYGAHVVRLTM